MTGKESIENSINTDTTETPEKDTTSIEHDGDNTQNQDDFDDWDAWNETFDDDDVIEVNFEEDEFPYYNEPVKQTDVTVVPTLPTYIMTNQGDIERVIKNVYVLDSAEIKHIVFTQTAVSGTMVWDGKDYLDYLEFNSLPGKPDTIDSVVLIWFSTFNRDYKKLIHKLEMWGIRRIFDHESYKITDIHEYLKQGSKRKKNIISKARKLASIL